MMDVETENLELLRGPLSQNVVKRTLSLLLEGDQAYSSMFSTAHEMRCLRFFALIGLFLGRFRSDC